MTQVYTVNCFESSNVGQSDLQNMENNFAALKSNFSGTTAPSVSVEAGQSWFDTTKKLLKIRNQANSAWLGVMYGDTSQFIWVYRNTAPDGWVVSSALTDRVIAIKGGTYGATGGTTAGTWSISGLTNSATNLAHTHTGPSHTHTLNKYYEGVQPDTPESPTTNVIDAITMDASGTGATGSALSTHGHTISSAATWRAAAAVGSLMYPNV